VKLEDYDMSNSYFVRSDLGLVIDVEGAKAQSGTPVDAYTAKFTPTNSPPTQAQLSNAKNQLWTFIQGPFPGSFFIQSLLVDNADSKDPALVLDIKGGKTAPGTPVQVYAKKATGSAEQNNKAKNQLWQWLAQPQVPPAPGRLPFQDDSQFIQSVLDSKLVLDIKGGKSDPGASLQVYSTKQIKSYEDYVKAANQLWSQEPLTLPRIP
jgi:hypothetical protein